MKLLAKREQFIYDLYSKPAMTVHESTEPFRFYNENGDMQSMHDSTYYIQIHVGSIITRNVRRQIIQRMEE